jgi:hypothetical protein
MYRKETFGVSGPHIKVRFFGGWNYADSTTVEQRRDFWKTVPDWIKDREWVRAAYAQGVPMGGDLSPSTAPDKAPSFAVWAVKDPSSGNLDRIQIVKGWTRSGQSFEKVFDVAWAGDRVPDKWTGVVPPIGSTVDLEKATYTNTIGAIELKSVWSDPEFDPSVPAFYYARVLEIPTPRWTTIQAAQLGIATPDVVPATVQERAWSSPIWYTPAAAAQKVAKVGPTVDELKRQGAVALNDAQIKALIVDKTPWLQNNVTNAKFRIIYSSSGIANATQTLTPIDPRYVTSKLGQNQGQALVDNVGRNVVQPSAVGDAAAASYFGTPSPYYINNGKIVTVFAGTPIEVTPYKLGDKYYGARSNEFGYANYEIVPTPLNLNTLGQTAPVAHNSRNAGRSRLAAAQTAKQQCINTCRARALSLAKLKDKGTPNSMQMTANDRFVHFMLNSRLVEEDGQITTPEAGSSARCPQDLAGPEPAVAARSGRKQVAPVRSRTHLVNRCRADEVAALTYLPPAPERPKHSSEAERNVGRGAGQAVLRLKEILFSGQYGGK